MLLKDHSASSVYHSLSTTRSNATHVGTLELIRAIHDTLAKLEDESIPLNSAQDALMLTTDLLQALATSTRSSATAGSTRKPSPKRKFSAGSCGSNSAGAVRLPVLLPSPGLPGDSPVPPDDQRRDDKGGQNPGQPHGIEVDVRHCHRGNSGDGSGQHIGKVSLDRGTPARVRRFADRS